MTKTMTVRVTDETNDRLRSMAQAIGVSTADLVRTLSHADVQLVLACAARRGAAEAMARGEGA